MTPHKKLLAYVSRYKTIFALGIFCLLAGNVFKALVPIVIQRSVDTLADGITYSLLLRYSAMVIVLGLVQGGCVFAQARLLLGAARCIERDMKTDFYGHLQKLPPEFFQVNRTGELMARVSNDIGAGVNASTEAFMYSANTLVVLAVILPLMTRLSWPLTLMSFAPLLLVIISTLFLQKQMRSRFEKVQESFGRICARVQETLWGTRTIRAYTQEHAEVEKFRELSQQYVRHDLSHTRVSSLLYPVLEFFIGLSFLAVLWYGGDLTAAGKLSIGQLLEFILYLGYLAWPMHVLGWELTVLQRGIVSMGRVDSILCLRPTIQDPDIPLDIRKLHGSLEFRNVTFTYKGADRPALERISLSIGPGQMVALVGAVGSGKTTLMNMVPRLLEPFSGDILIDGHSVRQIPLNLLRSSIGYVPQEAFLFSDTIAANIAFGNRESTQEEIKQAAINSGVDSDITAFPLGYETAVGERGVTLSGGQKQRISIARALLLHPPILLLDDALSSVDSYTEEKILARLRNVMRGAACLMSCHRISTSRNADLIIVLQEGKIVEQGTHDELLAAGGIYAEMHATQLLEEDLAAAC